jgi:manganese efflux pump family protein
MIAGRSAAMRCFRWIAAGACGLIARVRGRGRLALPTTRRPTGRLVLTGLALGVDNLAVGLALGAYQVPVVLAAIVGQHRVVTIGLEMGARIGARAGDWGEIVGSLTLIVVGVAIASGVF